MKSVSVYGLLLVLCVGCLQKPKPWTPPDDFFQDEAEVKEDIDAAHDVLDDNAGDVEAEASSDAAEARDEADHADVDSEVSGDVPDDVDVDTATDAADALDVEADTPNIDLIDQGDTLEIDITDQAEAPDGPDCPPGYSWDPEKQKCVSFCPADKYYEEKMGKCLYYPCCDLSGTWTVSVLDSDTMNFTIYELTLGQTVSYMDAFLELDSPPEAAECSGTVQKKNFVLTCVNELYSLLLSSGTVEDDGSFSGFYTYNFKGGTVKSGPFNIDKK